MVGSRVPVFFYDDIPSSTVLYCTVRVQCSTGTTLGVTYRGTFRWLAGFLFGWKLRLCQTFSYSGVQDDSAAQY